MRINNNNEKFIIERLVREDILDISGAISKNGLEITGGEVNIANYLKAIGSNRKSKFSTPIFVNLDRLDITDSFYIDNFSTSFVSDRINGNFEVIVSGQRKGTGSSRETAAQCERWAGIRIVIAASFAPILSLIHI